MRQPINFSRWIDEHRHLLKPPVGNAQIWQDSDFLVTVVGGPNARRDFHVDESEEFFYQLEGDMVLKLALPHGIVDMPIRQGEMLLLPPRVPHSPRRPANTLGLVIERQRRSDEKDGFVWFCENCDHKLHEEYVFVKDLVRDLPSVFNRFYGDKVKTTCTECGRVHVKPDVDPDAKN